MKHLVQSIIEISPNLTGGIETDQLLKRLISLGYKANPEEESVVILARGSIKGKVVVLKDSIAEEKPSFDLDTLTSLSLKTQFLKEYVKKEFGVDLNQLRIKSSVDEDKLDRVFSGSKSDLNVLKSLFMDILVQPRKPDLIIDIMLKDLAKFNNLAYRLAELGYDKQHIHVVWNVDDFESALKDSQNDDNETCTDVLMNCRQGVVRTMHALLSMGDRLKRYMDGDFIFTFDKVNTNTVVANSKLDSLCPDGSNYVYVKRAGQLPTAPESLDEIVKANIRKYTPARRGW